jgi:hypothetical protein
MRYSGFTYLKSRMRRWKADFGSFARSEQINSMPSPIRIFSRSAAGRSSEATFMGIRRSALIEMTVMLVLLAVVDYFKADNAHFSTYTFHPFWIVVLVISVQYGLAESLACAAMASLFLFLGHLPPQEITETMFDYARRVTLLPFLWLTAAGIIGSIRARQIKERDRLRFELREAHEREDAIAQEYTRLRKSNEKLEMRLALEENGLVSAYQAACQLQAPDEKTLVAAFRNVLAEQLRAEKFSYFQAEGEKLHCAFGHGWEEQDGFERSFAPGNPLQARILRDKAAACLLNAKDEGLLNRQGVLAAPVMDTRSGQVFGMLKIEAMPFGELQFNTLERCKLLAQWMGMAIANARAAHPRQTVAATALKPDFWTAAPAAPQEQHYTAENSLPEVAHAGNA